MITKTEIMEPKETKVVNIYATRTIRLNPPIRGTVRRVTKSISEIRICLLDRAMVEEVLSDGSIVRLDITNYNIRHTPVKKQTTIDTPVDKKPVEETKTNKEENAAENDTTEETVASVEQEQINQNNNKNMSREERRKNREERRRCEREANKAKSENKEDVTVLNIEDVL